VLRCAENQVPSVGDETYRVVSCLCVMVGDILRVSISRVLTRGRCELPLAWRLASRISWCAEDVRTLRVAHCRLRTVCALLVSNLWIIFGETVVRMET
jgi:hypothetical protein